MSILSIFSAERNVQKKQQAAAMKKQMAKKEVEDNVLCFDGRVMVPAALFFFAAGAGAAAATAGCVKNENPDSVAIAACAGLSALSIGIGSVLTVNEVQKANRMFDYVVDTAAHQTYISEVFQRILTCELYKGEKSFMKIVELLDGVSDADKQNLRLRYQEYQTHQMELAAAKAREMIHEENKAEQQPQQSAPAPQAQQPQA